MAVQEFFWLHVMNVSLGVVTLLVIALMIAGVASEIARSLRPRAH
jgi:hypothetical protein